MALHGKKNLFLRRNRKIHMQHIQCFNSLNAINALNSLNERDALVLIQSTWSYLHCSHDYISHGTIFHLNSSWSILQDVFNDSPFSQLCTKDQLKRNLQSEVQGINIKRRKYLRGIIDKNFRTRNGSMFRIDNSKPIFQGISNDSMSIFSKNN